jgi:hypothetical protein
MPRVPQDEEEMRPAMALQSLLKQKNSAQVPVLTGDPKTSADDRFDRDALNCNLAIRCLRDAGRRWPDYESSIRDAQVGLSVFKERCSVWWHHGKMAKYCYSSMSAN